MPLDITEMLKALAVETRVKIIEILKSEGPLGAKKLAAMMGLTPAAVSQHLKILRQVGFVRSERNGYWIPYRIDEAALDKCHRLLAQICTCGCDATTRFREKETETATLAQLKHYARQMESELQIVRARIKALESEKA